MRRNGWCLEPFFEPEVRGVERYLNGETADRKRGRHFHEPRQQFASLPRVMAPPQGTVKQRPTSTGGASGTRKRDHMTVPPRRWVRASTTCPFAGLPRPITLY